MIAELLASFNTNSKYPTIKAWPGANLGTRRCVDGYQFRPIGCNSFHAMTDRDLNTVRDCVRNYSGKFAKVTTDDILTALQRICK